MPSSFRRFSAGASFGPGHSAPRRSVRQQIGRILSYVADAADGGAAPGSGDGADAIYAAIRKFQRRLNLKPDGVVTPGGPTESALNTIAVAGEKGGPRLARAIEPAIGDLTKQGLTLTPDPRNPEALGMWRDRSGGRVAPEQAGTMLRWAGDAGAAALTGPQQIFAERLVGRTGRDKLMQGAAATAAAQAISADSVKRARPELGASPVKGAKNRRGENVFTSGSVRRLADRTVEHTDAARREIERERAQNRPHRDIESIEWEEAPRTRQSTTKFAAKIKDAVRIDFHSDAFGVDGADIEVDWLPLDERGSVVPEFRRPGNRRQKTGGLVVGRPFGGGASRILVSPYPNPHGFRVEIRVPPQPSVNRNSKGVFFDAYVPKGEFVSEEKIR